MFLLIGYIRATRAERSHRVHEIRITQKTRSASSGIDLGKLSCRIFIQRPSSTETDEEPSTSP